MLDGVNTDGTAGYFDIGAVEEMIVRPAGNDPEIAAQQERCHDHERALGTDLRITAILPPRVARLGFTYSF